MLAKGMIKKVSPILWTQKLEETVEFYTHILLFECDAMDLKAGRAKMRKGEATIMLSLPNEHIPFKKPHFTGSIYLYTNNVTSEWELVKDLAEVCYSLEKFDYGMWEFAIYDNNGYMIQFGQSIDV